MCNFWEEHVNYVCSLQSQRKGTFISILVTNEFIWMSYRDEVPSRHLYSKQPSPACMMFWQTYITGIPKEFAGSSIINGYLLYPPHQELLTVHRVLIMSLESFSWLSKASPLSSQGKISVQRKQLYNMHNGMIFSYIRCNKKILPLVIMWTYMRQIQDVSYCLMSVTCET